MRKTDATVTVDRRILALVLFMFLVNTLLLAGGFHLLNSRFSPVAEDFDLKQSSAKELVDYNRRLAKNLGVDTRSQVRNALSQFNYEIELATNVDDINKAILYHGSRTQERILQEYVSSQRETVLALVNQDPAIPSLTENQRLTVQLLAEQEVQVEPANLLSEETILKISETVTTGELGEDLVIDVEVVDGRGQLVTPYDPLEHIRTLTREMDSLRVTLHDLRTRSGFAEQSGAGIIVNIYDADDGFTSDTIIHDSDVRDTVNELFAAGAQGLAVGNQRLIVTSAIRCVGPSILVNDERIAVNPVVIRAIGDPDVLASGLDLIRMDLEIYRNLRVEIEKVDNLTVPAYTR
ncbi:MAG: DUF881 domain-containing protein [Bacillota bacterium]|nr:DUF881 domain-containing protein [Bacillota bacterium]MDW7683482.1 DUF881 domain-containing protein [Bacillota bacterium]